MKQALWVTILNGILAAQLSVCLAGTDSVRDSKDMKQIAIEPPPAELCDWTGFYLGIHSGGQFGHSATHDFATGPCSVMTNRDSMVACSSATTFNGNGWWWVRKSMSVT